MKLLSKLVLFTALGLLSALPLTAAPLGTAFTYQGKLADGGQPANGRYDFQFALHDAANGGVASGSVMVEDLWLTNGLFSVALDFGTGQFTGQACWLEVQVRPGTSGAAFTALLPRQALTAAPYAQFALNGNPGPIGPIGPAGSPGPVGPMGAASIVGSGFVAGTTAYPTSTTQFLAPPVTVTITAPGQRVYVSANRALGGYVAASKLSLNIAYRSTSTPGAAPTTIGLGMDGLQVPANTRIPMGISGVITNLAVGTYHVGLAGNDDGSGKWNNSEWGFTSAFVFNQP